MLEKMMKPVMNFMMRSMASCEEVSQLTSDSLDRKLTFRERMRAGMHIFFCKWCARYKKQLFFIKETLGLFDSKLSQGPVNGTPKASDDFKARMKATIESQND